MEFLQLSYDTELTDLDLRISSRTCDSRAHGGTLLGVIEAQSPVGLLMEILESNL